MVQLGTLGTISKVVFALSVIGILIYIVVTMQKINPGGWKIIGDDTSIKFISPKNESVLSISDKDKGIYVKNYLVHADNTGLHFKSPKNVLMATLREKEMDIGGITLADNTDVRPDAGSQGLKIYNNKVGKDISYISNLGLRIPEYNLLLKGDGYPSNPKFQVYDLKNNKVLLSVPSVQSGSFEYNLI